MFEDSGFSISVLIFLLVYGAYMLFYIIYSLFNIYHLIRYGIYGYGLYLIVTIFTGGTIILIAGSVFMLVDYNWSTPLMLDQTTQQFYSDNGFFEL